MRRMPALVSSLPFAAAAAGAHDALAPAGPQAAHIAQLWWLTFWICAFVFAAVLAGVAWAVWRAPRGDPTTPPQTPAPPERERRFGRGVAAALAVSVVLLVALLVASIATDRALAELPVEGAVRIHLTAYQWWWEVTYDDADPQRVFSTANEIRVPVGRPVLMTLESGDVIHSFWAPSLHGKKDLIPGRTATIRFLADRPGDYRAQCAEYCGMQHALMGLDVIAVAPPEFDAWLEAQRKPAAEPQEAAARRGRDLFLSGSCMLCHAVRGTSAGARKAPDLTHVASRATLAAGRLANTPDDMAAWIADPQRIKPGANMPAHPLPPEDLRAVVAYLETLR